MANGTGEHDWEKFWGTVWYNLLHALGVAAVLSFAFGIVWSFFSDSKPSTSTRAVPQTDELKENLFDNQARRTVFSNKLMRESKPCARKNKGGSDVSACSVFGLKPGMSYELVKYTVDSSGYFPMETILTELSDNPLGAVREPEKVTGQSKPASDKAGAATAEGVAAAGKSASAAIRRFAAHHKDGLYLSVDFVAGAPDEGTEFKASNITLSLSPGANPYFDPQSVRSVFLKLLGPPDLSDGRSDEWGRGGAEHIRAYVLDESYWVTFRGNSTGQSKED